MHSLELVLGHDSLIFLGGMFFGMVVGALAAVAGIFSAMR
jgi:hypothetical protein